MSSGISGMRTMSAPEAMPALRVSQPASRPMSSTTKTRLCELAVEWM